jgi:hypothetical protein
MPAVRNRSGHAAKLAYRVRARGHGGTAVKTFTITVAAAVEDPAPPPALPGPPPTPPGVAAMVEGSTNWSGYAMTPGPYTAVSGSFNVPALQADDPEKIVSEWVGVDGFDNTSLIQAGIEEGQDVAAGQTRAVAWWEILPAAPVPIPVAITTGDQVTVAISQLGSTSWRISLTDDTTGRSFVTDQPYVGSAGSAEWIVEAPSLAIGLPYPLAPYFPAVTFRNLAFTGPEDTLTEIVMRQGHTIVSTPSVPSAAGFSVAYGAVAPPAP